MTVACLFLLVIIIAFVIALWRANREWDPDRDDVYLDDYESEVEPLACGDCKRQGAALAFTALRMMEGK